MKSVYLHHFIHRAHVKSFTGPTRGSDSPQILTESGGNEADVKVRGSVEYKNFQDEVWDIISTVIIIGYKLIIYLLLMKDLY